MTKMGPICRQLSIGGRPRFLPNHRGQDPKLEITKKVFQKLSTPNSEKGFFPSEKYKAGHFAPDNFKALSDLMSVLPMTKPNGEPGLSRSIQDTNEAIQHLPDFTDNILELGAEVESLESEKESASDERCEAIQERQTSIFDTLTRLSVQYAWLQQQQIWQPVRLRQLETGKMEGEANPYIKSQIARPNLALSYLLGISPQQNYDRYSGPPMFIFPEGEDAHPGNVEVHAQLEGPKTKNGKPLHKEMTYLGKKISFVDDAEKQFQLNHGLQEDAGGADYVKAAELVKEGLLNHAPKTVADGYIIAAEAGKRMGEIMRCISNMSDPKEYGNLRTWLVAAKGRETFLPQGLLFEGAEEFGLPDKPFVEIGETGAQAGKQILGKELGGLVYSATDSIGKERQAFFQSQLPAQQEYALEVRDVLQSCDIEAMCKQHPDVALARVQFLFNGPVMHQKHHLDAAFRHIYSAGDLSKNSGGTPPFYLGDSLLKTIESTEQTIERINRTALSKDQEHVLAEITDSMNDIKQKTISRQENMRKRFCK